MNKHNRIINVVAHFFSNINAKVTLLQYTAHLTVAIVCFITDLDFPGVVQHDESKKKTSGEADQALQDRRIYRILKEKM